jgi:hypothetical protein
MRTLWLAALVAVSTTAALPAAAQSMTPGEWEFTTTTTSPALPKPQAATVTQCVTPEDAQDPAHFSGTGGMQDCKLTPGERTADTYSWTVSCPAQGLTGEGKVRFGGDSIDGTVRVVVDAQGQKMQMSSRTLGRRLGPCKTK